MGHVELTANAWIVLRKRYLRKDGEGRLIETPDGMFRRVAHDIASVNEAYGDRDTRNEEEEFFEAMRSLSFLPNSPTLMNAGTQIQQLAACFVLPVDDSIEGIFDAVKWAAVVHQSGGGTGFSFSRLRPTGDMVASTSGEASGPLSFMRVFDVATEAVRQGGRRRGASMGVLRVDHPDIRSFVRAKDRSDELTNFNISVAVTDEFMDGALDDGELSLRDPRSGSERSRVSARDLYQDICSTAWAHGDPGVIFIDEINRHNPTPQLGSFETTNPCGEVPLLPFEACNLGSINLAKMMVQGSNGPELDLLRLDRTVDLAVRFLDNVIDAGHYPLPQIEAVVHGNRKIGLGVMGFADVLIIMGIRYGSERSIALVDRIMSRMRSKAEEASRRISESRGAFPNFEGSALTREQRNATVLSIAPTGTISIIAGCSSGIEPHYAFHFERHVLDGEVLKETDPLFLRALDEHALDRTKVLSSLVDRSSIQDLSAIPEGMKEIFVTSHDIPPKDQIGVQAAFQVHVDNAVSKTINLRSEATVADIAEAFALAHRSRCKGITVYREGSKAGQVLTAPGRLECVTCGRLERLADHA